MKEEPLLETIDRLIDEGLTRSEIMQRMGISQYLLQRTLFTLRKRPINANKRRSATREWVKQLAQGQELSASDIARRVGVSKERVRQILKSEGIRLPNHSGRRWEEVMKVKRAAVQRLHSEGLNDIQIASRLGCSPNSVYNARKRLGLPAHKQQTKRLKTSMDAIREVLSKDITIAQAAAELGVCVATVSHYRLRLELDDLKRERGI